MHTFQMSTIKVLHVIARMNVGGTAKYVGDLVINIPQSALATGYIQGGEIEDSVVTGIAPYRVQHLGRKISPLNDLRAFVELWRIVREVNPEILHTHTFKAGFLGRLVPGRHKRIHTFHGHLFGDQSFSKNKKILITLAERILARRTDTLISVGQRVGNELRESGVGRKKNWISIPPGVEPLLKIEKKLARKQLNMSPDIFLVGWMARVTSVKNPKLLIEVAKNLPEIHFVMAGGGDLFNEISRIAPPNLQILGWVDASLFWSAIDIAISTSDNEGMPIALIEAQLAGVPVIATDVGSNSEVIIDSITGILCLNEINDLMANCKKLSSNVDLRVSMSQKAPIVAQHLFSMKVFIEHHCQLYLS
jgi:glycosyltransferase involved in cell wall biosynthesis